MIPPNEKKKVSIPLCILIGLLLYYAVEIICLKLFSDALEGKITIAGVVWLVINLTLDLIFPLGVLPIHPIVVFILCILFIYWLMHACLKRLSSSSSSSGRGTCQREEPAPNRGGVEASSQEPPTRPQHTHSHTSEKYDVIEKGEPQIRVGRKRNLNQAYFRKSLNP